MERAVRFAHWGPHTDQKVSGLSDLCWSDTPFDWLRGLGPKLCVALSEGQSVNEFVSAVPVKHRVTGRRLSHHNICDLIESYTPPAVGDLRVRRHQSTCSRRSCSRRASSVSGRPECLASSQRRNDLWLSPDGRPSSKPSTLRCSSRSGQWIPSPSPINSQWFRSLALSWVKRGYQSRGTEMLLPSDRSTVKVSSLAEISVALAN